MSLTRAATIARAFRLGLGRDVVKEIRRYFNVSKKTQSTVKWVYGIETLFAMELPTGRLKSFAELAREQEATT